MRYFLNQCDDKETSCPPLYIVGVGVDDAGSVTLGPSAHVAALEANAVAEVGERLKREEVVRVLDAAAWTLHVFTRPRGSALPGQWRRHP